jgi:hypothetical protein
MIIKGYVQELPTDSGSTAAAIARDAMSNNADSGQLFDVQMKQIAR